MTTLLRTKKSLSIKRVDVDTAAQWAETGDQAAIDFFGEYNI